MTILTDSNIRTALDQVNQEFAQQEATAPAQGYRVQFLQDNRGLVGKLIPVGSREKKSSFSTPALANCPFCEPAAVYKTFQNQNRAIVSLSQQLLVIPQKHYAHWFEAPLDDQIQLINQAIEVRRANLPSIRSPIELHCGRAAGQTVFHIHVRTGVYI